MKLEMSNRFRKCMGCFKYQGPQVAANGGCERDVVHRMKNEVYKRGEM